MHYFIYLLSIHARREQWCQEPEHNSPYEANSSKTCSQSRLHLNNAATVNVKRCVKMQIQHSFRASSGLDSRMHLVHKLLEITKP